MRKMYLALAAALLTAATAHANAASGEIAVIVKTANSNYWQNVQKGATEGMKGLNGYTMTFQGPATESAVADEVNMVENAVNRHVAAIVLAPSDPDALIPAMKKAWEAKIPVVLIDSLVSDSGKQYYQSFLSTDNAKAGELCAKAMIDRVGQTGKVAVMSYVAGAGSEIWPRGWVPEVSRAALEAAGSRTVLLAVADGNRAQSDDRRAVGQSGSEGHLRCK
ncbi:ABC-type sugar transport system substrate-binding protein [Paraburkholderia sp. MM5482-R1]